MRNDKMSPCYNEVMEKENLKSPELNAREGIQQCHRLLDEWLDRFKEQSVARSNELADPALEQLNRSEALLMENHLRAVVDNMETLTEIEELGERDKLMAVFIATLHDKARLSQALIGDENHADQLNGRPHGAMSAIQALGKGQAYDMLKDTLWGLPEDDARWGVIMDGVGEGVAYDVIPNLTEGDEDWRCLFCGIALHMYPKQGLPDGFDLAELSERERHFLDLTTNADAAANLSHKFPDPNLTEHLMIVNGHTLDGLRDSMVSDDVFESAMERDAVVDYKMISETNGNRNAADWFVAWMCHVYEVTSPDVAAALLDRGSIDTMAEIVEYTNDGTRERMQGVAAKCKTHLEKVKAQKYPE